MHIHELTDTLVLELTTPPNDTRPVFITGNFCEWLPDLPEYQMKETTPGHFTFEFPEKNFETTPFEYKYTRGGWDQVELDRYGQQIPNRIFSTKSALIQDFVPRWQKDNKKKPGLMPIVEVLSQTFEIPQLAKKRKVHILLPHDYYENPDKKYPVLYMTDAQNLFGEGSAYGNWEIDKSLAELSKENNGDVIVVAIDHAGDERVMEFSPYDNPKLGKGLGSIFLHFLTKTLKPFVDKQYRTKPDRLNTGMGGSSVGGLLTIYAALMHPDTFGRLMIFSPSLWISQKIYFDAINFFEPFETKIYIYGGGREGDGMVANIDKLNETLKNQGFGYSRVKINTAIDPKGEHSEERWGIEFPKALKWLYSDK